jgi:hypothetical protein
VQKQFQSAANVGRLRSGLGTESNSVNILGKDPAMKAITALLTILAVPIGILNCFGGIVSSIWLAVLGEWTAIFLGVLYIVGGPFLIRVALAPGLGFAVPAMGCLSAGRRVAAHVLILFYSAYTCGVVSIWCSIVMAVFMGWAAKSSLVIPLLIWSYGVAILPLCYLSAKDGSESASLFTTFFAAVGYIAGGLWAALGAPTLRDILLLFACIMSICFVALSINVALTLNQAHKT